MTFKHTIGAAIAVFTLLGGTASASTIFGATSISSPNGDFGGSFALDNAINQQGLSQNYVSGVTDFDAFTSSATHESSGSFNSGFTNGNGLGQIFSFDLGSLLSLDGFAIWANVNSGSLTEFDLFADSNGDSGDGLGSLLGSFSVSGPGNNSFADIGSFGVSTTQYLHISTIQPQNTVGIGEIAFRQVAAVPVPAAFPLLGGALALFGFIGRRRRNAS